jgi:hypothetical protein
VFAQVDVTPVAHDEEIRTRLQSVLNATGWFTSPRVEVREGVVFLSGPAETVELKKWAGDLARSTQDARRLNLHATNPMRHPRKRRAGCRAKPA